MTERYRKTRLPPSRLLAIQAMTLATRGHYVMGFIEIDVTDARCRICEAAGEGTQISFTGWLMKCLASAIEEFPEVNAYRKGRTAYTFESVNVGTMIERRVDDKYVPLPYLVRDCDRKSVLEISREIYRAKEGEVAEELVIADRKAERIARVAVMLPGPIARLGMRVFFKDPVKKHRMMGSVGITAVGMFGRSGGWPLPIPNVHPLGVAVGGISRKPVYMGQGDTLEPREVLDLTLMFDHDIIDGAPAARFSARLIELMESAHGL